MAVRSERRRDQLAVLVDGRLVRRLTLEIRGGRVEEQQVDLQVREVGGLEVHLLGELVLDLQQPVHRPIARVLIELRQPVDPRALSDPLAGGELRQRLQRPIGDHREHHPLGARIQATAVQQPLERPVDPQRTPDPVKRPRPADRPRLHEPQPRTGAGGRPRWRIGIQPPARADPINRSIAARSIRSSRPKLCSTRTTLCPAFASHSLCASWRYPTSLPSFRFRAVRRRYIPRSLDHQPSTIYADTSETCTRRFRVLRTLRT